MGNRPPQKTVREGQFNRALDAMNFEMAQKTAASLAKFHHAYLAPMERRLLHIETITGIRLLRWIRYKLYLGLRLVIDRVWHPFYMRFSEEIPEEVKDPEPGPTEEPEPEPEDDGVSRILSLN